uniref:Uncharacterized protein n=1 Tax=Setaria viridis TaxID=4556 RepID=A0A4U6VI81_SETVI|nr:hypothetical protein SEVIR_3G315203v2 [Setaria viridis]
MVILRSTSLGTGKIQISLQSAMHPSQIDRDEVCSWVGILPTQIEDGEVHLRLVRALLHAVDDSEFASISLQNLLLKNMVQQESIYLLVFMVGLDN